MVNLTIKRSPGQGRYTLSKKNIEKGEKIVIGKPYGFAVSRQVARHICAWSLEWSNKALTECCPHCKLVYYKDAESRKAGLRIHYPECKAMAALIHFRLSVPYYLCGVIIIRAIIRKAFETGLKLPFKGDIVSAEEKELIQKGGFPEWMNDGQSWNDFAALVDNQENFGNVRIRSRISFAKMLEKIIPKDVLKVAFGSAENIKTELLRCVCRYECNCFGYFSPKGKHIGSAIIPIISYINHSCQPNGETQYYDICGPMEVIANKFIPKGEEVNISYVNNKWGRKERQEHLKRNYFFDCACPRCKK